ncbi:MAG: PEP-CTERM sorting domain-containing protein, partial [Planctomycetaceae bacterium]
YIAISDGAYLSVTPPAEFDPNFLEPFGAGLRFTGYLDPYFIQTFPLDPVFHGLQYSVHGYLAPGAQLTVSGRARVTQGSVVYSDVSLDFLSLTTPGNFSLAMQDFRPLSNLSIFTGGFLMEFDMSIGLNTRSGAERSWVVLDPGAGVGTDPDNLFPWVQTSAVPEPSSAILFGLTVVGGLFGAARRRSKLRGSAPPD